jgi:alcohol dehydrogenase/propanol-preferring alcohol dehydrogenase
VIGAGHDGLRYLTEALALVAAGSVTPVVEVFPSERVMDAIDKVETGRVRFRAVVTY